MSRPAALPVTPGGWYRRVWAVSWPIILSNLSVPLVGAVDTAVVGHLPDPALIGAVALGAIIFNFLYWGFGFLRMGTTGLVAQDLGADDREELLATFARAVLTAACLGLAIVLLADLFGALAFTALQGSVEVESHAERYYAIRVFSAPAALLNYAILGLFIGLQNTRAALLLQLFLNGVNVTLDLIFVLGLGWGVEGVATATLIGECSATALGLWLACRALRRLGGRWRPERILDAGRLKALLRVNLDIFVRTLCLISAFFYFTSKGAELGDVLLAANAVLLHFQHFMAFGLDGFAHAAEALAGSAYGARDTRAFRAAVRASTLLALAVAAAYAVAYALLGTIIIGLITGIAEVRATAQEYLPWQVLIPFVAVWSYQLDGIYIGTVRTAEMRNGMVVSLVVYLGAVAVLLPAWGNHGLWAALTVFLAARAVTLGLWYPRIPRALEAASLARGITPPRAR